MKLPKTCSKVYDSVKRSSILLQNKRLLIHTENCPKMKTPIPGLMNYTSWMGTKLCMVLSGDWINVAIINANQYNIEQVVQTKFQDVGY